MVQISVPPLCCAGLVHMRRRIVKEDASLCEGYEVLVWRAEVWK